MNPWHYHDPFFQEAPAVYEANLDAAYSGADVLKLCRDFYAGIGLPIDDVIARSDLYEKPGKSPHAFCTDIDRNGDVRVLANIVPNEYWMGTMLHELGHSVYSSKNIPDSVPYVLRSESHILTTEGVAMMFERFSKDADWLQSMGVKLDDPKAFDETGAKMLRDRLLIFSRWCQVMLRFEKAMYADPDRDLSALWWDLVSEYQGLRRPDGRHAPDYASKIHVVSAPCYYHNYMMGQLFASQVHHAIAREVLGGVDPAKASYVGNRKVGAFLTERIFAPGKTLAWNALTRHATGADLTPSAFAADFRATA
jgi:peptidyl-dipeptidase A